MRGIQVSPGIAIGKAYLIGNKSPKVERKQIDNIEAEIERFHRAKACCMEQIRSLCSRVTEELGKNEAAIFEAHCLMLEDPEMISNVEAKIKAEKVNAEFALREFTDNYLQAFAAIKDEYLRERAADVLDVTEQIIKCLLGFETDRLAALDKEVVIVADELKPSDVARLNREFILGIITEKGGKTSHAAIIARSLEIPTISGVSGITSILKGGEGIIIDGEMGIVVVSPDKKTVQEYLVKQKEFQSLRNEMLSLKNAKSQTTDGYTLEIMANISYSADLQRAKSYGCEGVGLYRTEFLFMDRKQAPGEEEQFKAYQEAALQFGDKPVIIRTLDIGGDKDVKYMGLIKEENPFLGYRAIRLLLDQIEIFKIQLRAILRASAHGNIKLMFPMVTTVDELRQAKLILDNVKEELKREKVKFNDLIEVGIMIETPAAAIISDKLAKEADFFSIGTNDLVQYTVAVDRGNQRVSYLYDYYDPAVLRLIKLVIENGHQEGIKVGICGEAAADPKLVPLLVGMEIDELSMDPFSVLKVKSVLGKVSKEETKKLVKRAINQSTAEETKQILEN